MSEEIIYGKWLEIADEQKQKFFGLQWVGMVLFAVCFAGCLLILNQTLILSACVGFFPLFFCFLASFGYYDQWKECEYKYKIHMPYMEMIKKDVLIAALTFEPGTVICTYMTHVGQFVQIALPADQIQICRTEDDEDVLQFQKDINNYTHEEKCAYIRLCLKPSTQQKLVALCS